MRFGTTGLNLLTKMKTKLINCLFWFVPLVAPAMDYDKLADAVAIVESNNNPAAVGDGGRARGAYQMWEIAWTQASKARRLAGKKVYPYAYAHDAFVSRQYAVSYLQWCGSTLEKRLGRPAAFWEIYACYARGLGGFEDIDYNYTKLPAHTKRALGVISKQLNLPLPR